MVVPSSAKSRRKRHRNRNTDILAVITVTAIAVGAAWLVASSFISQSSSTSEVKIQLDDFASPSMEAGGVPDDASEEGIEGQDMAELDGVMHLSAKTMLATKRPYLMYGTAWKKDDTADLVFQAVHAGFRFIDTACQPKHYNEAGVGYGWKTAAETMGLSREDFFLQTKFTAVGGQDPNNLPYMADASLEDQVRQSVHTSLRNLQTDYIDSLVLHSPMETMDLTLRVWTVFEEFVQEGKVNQLGISNCYKPTDLKQLHQGAKIKPTILQNRFYKDSNFDIELRGICKSLGIQYQSFWTLSGNRKALASSDWIAMAQEKELTPQTLMYAFIMTLGYTPLSGTKDASHMEDDVDIMVRFQHGEKILNEEEVNRLSSLLGIR
eukprot:CAMPEP_0172307070 /NCGR_PEP_ID=MMETSP1058-20130122/8000_1 /TAXON_ID=83371 /ORGANISM="Detonula confervacea, Strain CCMP 353" /LENGTH=378 /DNA_ID=CAMNT_0013019141 /DNA_START=76 /DNA_END=1212 /DNA_ORIENTATION=-